MARLLIQERSIDIQSNAIATYTSSFQAFFLGKECHAAIELASLATNTKKKRWQAMSQRHSSEKPNEAKC